MIKFITPIDGDCLNLYDGIISKDGLTITVTAESDSGEIYINGVKCDVLPDMKYTAQITFDGRTCFITAENMTNGEVAGIKVFYFVNRTGYFRISVDDNILFLKDINDNRDKYTSVFENPFLALYKKAHDLYGAKVHINLFYEYDKDAMSSFKNHKEYFNLSMMTGKFKDEFIENSGWLHFSFHSRAEFPDRPYVNTTYARIDSDIRLVKGEIERFAGAQISPPVTTLHWGVSNETGVRALRANGYKLLNGEFDETPDGKPFVSYHYPAAFTRHVRGREFWKDNSLDVIFSKYDTVLNKYRHASDIIPVLENIKANVHTGGFMELLIHEQYFYEDYKSYIPEYGDIVLTACKWAAENGYRGMFFSDIWELNK